MPVNTPHPDYDAHKLDWDSVRDAMEGDRKVKDRNEAYLPTPTGFSAAPDPAKAYAAYKMRARFPSILAPSIRGMTGIIHRTETQIDLPDALMAMWEKATPDGATLEALHRRITQELLTTGRYGLLVDMPANAAAGTLPFIADYKAEAILNWSPEQDFFVLDESKFERDEYEWTMVHKYRVLRLKDGVYSVEIVNQAGEKLTDDEGKPLPDAVPVVRGGDKFKDIPFIVIGATDVNVAVDEIPLLGVAQSSYTIYRLDADYKLQLYMTGQETLFLIGGSTEDTVKVIGSMVQRSLPQGSDVKYVGPSGVGIELHRQAILDERENAIQAGARLFDSASKGTESGEALRIRFAGQTATLTSIAQASAQGLERALRQCAAFVGADPEKVIVKTNLSFIDATLSPQDAASLVSVWQSGAISHQTLYENLQKGEIASSERDFDEEAALIEDEMPDPSEVAAQAAAALGIDPNAPPTNEQVGGLAKVKVTGGFPKKKAVPAKKPPPFTKKAAE